MGESLLVKNVYKSCEITMANKEMIVNLVILDSFKFNVILGMDWLAAYHAIIDYHFKMVKFNPLTVPSFMVQADQSLAPYNLISPLSL